MSKKKKKDRIEWEVKDTLKNSSKKTWTQIWNISDSFLREFKIVAKDENMIAVEPNIISSYTSPDYGILNEAKQVHFSTITNSLTTVITKK